MPTSVLALATFASLNGNCTPDSQFFAAWAQMPAIVQQMAHGDGDSADGFTRHACIRGLFNHEVAKSRASNDEYGQRLARLVDIIGALHDLSITDLEISLGDAAFYTGLTMGLYLMSNPAPILLAQTGGAR